mmetsp:Transcript_7853/g.21663  ORF Transcript_7853/g.21663 Transcript_7853/m.21663 type:complete len:209 (+) Transcript_7853:838-1464(+)
MPKFSRRSYRRRLLEKTPSRGNEPRRSPRNTRPPPRTPRPRSAPSRTRSSGPSDASRRSSPSSSASAPTRKPPLKRKEPKPRRNPRGRSRNRLSCTAWRSPSASYVSERNARRSSTRSGSSWTASRRRTTSTAPRCESHTEPSKCPSPSSRSPRRLPRVSRSAQSSRGYEPSANSYSAGTIRNARWSTRCSHRSPRQSRRPGCQPPVT